MGDKEEFDPRENKRRKMDLCSRWKQKGRVNVGQGISTDQNTTIFFFLQLNAWLKRRSIVVDIDVPNWIKSVPSSCAHPLPRRTTYPNLRARSDPEEKKICICQNQTTFPVHDLPQTTETVKRQRKKAEAFYVCSSFVSSLLLVINNK